jgi:hypothetical protein
VRGVRCGCACLIHKKCVGALLNPQGWEMAQAKMHAACTHRSEHSCMHRVSTNVHSEGWPALLSGYLHAQQSWLFILSFSSPIVHHHHHQQREALFPQSQTPTKVFQEERNVACRNGNRRPQHIACLGNEQPGIEEWQRWAVRCG